MNVERETPDAEDDVVDPSLDLEQGTSSASQVVSDVEPGSTHASKRRVSFIDYIPPPPRPVPPPAKYKLWLMVLCCVFFADWFATEAGYLNWLQDTFRLSRNGALLILLGTIVATLVFGALDLLKLCLRFKIRGEWYGLETWLKQPRIRWVHEYNNVVCQFIKRIVVIFEEGFAIFNVPKAPKPPLPKQFEADGDKEVVLKIENRIRADKMNEYDKWQASYEKMGCESRPGMTSVEHVVEGDVHICYITFSSIDYLNEFMTSPVRARLVRKLQPLLVGPTLVQVQKNRQLPDAFTDLCTQQGLPVPARLPKKWKVWWLTTLGLWFVVLITNSTLPHYYSAWGLDNAHDRAQATVRVIFNTFLNTYVMTPLLTMIFGNWLKRQEKEFTQLEPWRTLSDGFRTWWGKALLFLAYFGSCAIAWGVKAN